MTRATVTITMKYENKQVTLRLNPISVDLTDFEAIKLIGGVKILAENAVAATKDAEKREHE